MLERVSHSTELKRATRVMFEKISARSSSPDCQTADQQPASQSLLSVQDWREIARRLYTGGHDKRGGPTDPSRDFDVEWVRTGTPVPRLQLLGVRQGAHRKRVFYVVL